MPKRSSRTPPQPEVILAAGGIVWRKTSAGRQVAVIYRRRHRDWTLPKGKLHDGEGWKAAARREVREETGVEAEIGRFAGATCYAVDGVPKIVLFWMMRPRKQGVFRPSEEVAELAWLSPLQAARRLNYEQERKLLASALR